MRLLERMRSFFVARCSPSGRDPDRDCASHHRADGKRAEIAPVQTARFCRVHDENLVRREAMTATPDGQGTAPMIIGQRVADGPAINRDTSVCPAYDLSWKGRDGLEQGHTERQIAPMIEKFMLSDRAFLRWRQKRSGASPSSPV